MFLIKSAKDLQKQYPEGRWVTISREDSPLHGRHIFIAPSEGGMKVIAGGGPLNGKMLGDHKEKQPHEMTRHEYTNHLKEQLAAKRAKENPSTTHGKELEKINAQVASGRSSFDRLAAEKHRGAVKQAHAEGKRIPEEVMKEYGLKGKKEEKPKEEKPKPSSLTKEDYLKRQAEKTGLDPDAESKAFPGKTNRQVWERAHDIATGEYQPQTPPAKKGKLTPEIEAQAITDMKSGRVFMDRSGKNFMIGEKGAHGHPDRETLKVAPWNKEIREKYPDFKSLYDAAQNQPVTVQEAEPPKGFKIPPPDELDRKSENYLYRDIGYVPDSRKELAAQQVAELRAAGKSGRGVGIRDVNWELLESDPQDARDLITKEVVMKAADWEGMEKNGVEPGAAFLIHKLYSAVAPKPDDSPEARKDFVTGVNALQERFANAKTVDDVVKAVDQIGEEMTGFLLNPEQEATWIKLNEDAKAAGSRYYDLRREKDKVWDAYYGPSGRLNQLEWEQGKRTRRGWKPDPDLQQRIDTLKQEVDSLFNADQKWREEKGPLLEQAENDFRALSKQRSSFEQMVRLQNMVGHPLTRGFKSLGPRFLGAINYRSSKGSDAFGKHVATAQVGRIKDYSFLDSGERQRGATKQSVRFQLKVGGSIERHGGRTLKDQKYGTADLKEQFGLANVQSGNWVLNDLNAAKHHVEHTALAFQDMADILSIPDKHLSLSGRLSMAFGARGQGNAGWRDAPAAHYEPKHRVINLTKMNGGGSLAHEWFHAFDDITGEVETGRRTSEYREGYATHTPEAKTPVLQAFKELVSTMKEGDHTIKATKELTESEAAHWKTVFERAKRLNFYGKTGLKAINDSKDLSEAMAQIDDMHRKGKFGEPKGRKAKEQAEYHRQIAVAVHAGTKGEYDIPGLKGSSFYIEAKKMSGDYWSSIHEMGARAFSAYVSDRLHEKGRENTYLSAYPDNAYYILDGTKPYPEGEERQRINAAFDKLFEAVRNHKTLEKAMNMDRLYILRKRQTCSS